MLTGPEAGITRDTIAVDCNGTDERSACTTPRACGAPPRIQEKLEKLSVADAINAIRFAEVVVLLMDAEHAVREAGPAHRRSGRARGPGAGDRHQQVGPGRGAQAAASRELQRGGRRAAAAGQGRAGGRRVGPDRRRARPADGGDRRHPRGLEQAGDDATSSTDWLDDVTVGASAARGVGPAHQAQLHHPGQGPAADLRAVLHPRRRGCPRPTGATWSTRCARPSTCPARRSG